MTQKFSKVERNELDKTNNNHLFVLNRFYVSGIHINTIICKNQGLAIIKVKGVEFAYCCVEMVDKDKGWFAEKGMLKIQNGPVHVMLKKDGQLERRYFMAKNLKV